MYGEQCDAVPLVGDVTHLSTLKRLWPVAKGAATLVAGFACQPFSVLGDRRGGCDPRSTCLTGILAIAHFLQVHAIILECVQPAAGNDFVLGQIQRFVDISGFHVSQCDLRLDDVWPARRNRAWWLITSPLLGKSSWYHGQRVPLSRRFDIFSQHCSHGMSGMKKIWLSMQLSVVLLVLKMTLSTDTC